MKHRISDRELVSKTLIYEAFIELSKTPNKYEFSKGAQRWISKIFGLTTSKIVFREGTGVTECLFEENGNRIVTHDPSIGIIGYVIREQRAIIVNDVKLSKEYNSLVDIYSLLPVYTLPIVQHNKDSGEPHVSAVIQLVLSKKKEIPFADMLDEAEYNDFISGFDEPIEHLLKVFCNFVALSLQQNATMQ